MIKNFEANMSALKEMAPTLYKKIQTIDGNKKLKFIQTFRVCRVSKTLKECSRKAI